MPIPCVVSICKFIYFFGKFILTLDFLYYHDIILCWYRKYIIYEFTFSLNFCFINPYMECVLYLIIKLIVAMRIPLLSNEKEKQVNPCYYALSVWMGVVGFFVTVARRKKKNTENNKRKKKRECDWSLSLSPFSLQLLSSKTLASGSLLLSSLTVSKIIHSYTYKLIKHTCVHVKSLEFWISFHQYSFDFDYSWAP